MHLTRGTENGAGIVAMLASFADICGNPECKRLINEYRSVVPPFGDPRIDMVGTAAGFSPL